ncbi:PREDICTED: chaoptin isoform X7 [Nicrophorus vespilloides]|nr:PREDICTED: chaoptin isoform X7 [Nicrophorus vespilloides]
MLQCKWIFVTALLAFLLVDAVHGTTCSDLVDPMVRTFSDLSKYQGNKQAFDPMNTGSAGNYVQIDKVKSNLEKNDFISHQSDYIMRLYLGGKGIETMESQTFNQLHCLRYLNLEDNQLTELPGDVFNELEMMVHLNLSGNNLDNLPDELFGTMHRLKDLDLSHNKIRSLRRHLFENQTNLQHLNISHNQLNFLHLEDWKFLDSLAIVDLSFNVIHSIEFPTTFFFTDLTRMFLNDNQLKDLNVFSMRNKMPHLVLLRLDNNPFACDDLAYILRGLDDSKVNYDGRNKTMSNIGGIDCVDFTDAVLATLTPMAETNDKNDKIMEHVREMMTQINDLKIILFLFIIIFCIAMLFIFKQSSLTLGSCRTLLTRFQRTRSSDATIENLRLIP